MIKLQKSTFLHENETKEKLCEFIKQSRFLSMGNECKKFENNFSQKQGRGYSVFVNSGSGANLLLIQALLNGGQLKKGDVVAVSALTWSTNIMPIIQLGLQPFLVDCEINSLNVSIRTLEEAFQIEPNIKALFLTNTLGLADDIAGIADFCSKNKIILLEDNCEALGSIINGKLLGNFGLASTFSFFVGHHLSTIEGGMICTDNEKLYESIVMSRSHGWDRHLSPDSQKKIRKQYGIDDFFAKYTFYDLAYNLRPTEINGFIGNNQINYWDFIVDKRFNNFIRLHKAIENNKDLVALKFGHMDVVSSFAIPVILKDQLLAADYKKKFTDAEVEIRPMIAGNMARQPFYRKYVSNPGSQPNAEFIHSHSFYFGNNPELTNEELDVLEKLLRF
ncbi:MAG: DegT/DnrJ/EryC1/StrS family aminotransferase [Candidatus Pacebacteria bacterium]|nr:DegT/DnrJ/EryC1/StrS family aminotransferase [Candidatus Paceibacterota bacterium]